MTVPEPPRRAHRNETLLHIVLPVAGAGLLILIALVIALVLQRRVQLHMLADVLATICLLCPTVICLFPLYLLLALLAAAMGRAHDSTIPYLEKLQNLTHTMAQRVRSVLNAITKQVININTKIEPFLDNFSIFEKHNPQGKNK
ncbi:MAG: hypothetical protein U0694_12570 [Anaerolineae bacterium]